MVNCSCESSNCNRELLKLFKENLRLRKSASKKQLRRAGEMCVSCCQSGLIQNCDVSGCAADFDYYALIDRLGPNNPGDRRKICCCLRRQNKILKCKDCCECDAIAIVQAGFLRALSIRIESHENQLVEAQSKIIQDIQDIQDIHGKEMGCERRIAIGSLGAGYLIGLGEAPSRASDLRCLYNEGVAYIKAEQDICKIIKTGMVGGYSPNIPLGSLQSFSAKFGWGLLSSYSLNPSLIDTLSRYANEAISGTEDTPFRCLL